MGSSHFSADYARTHCTGSGFGLKSKNYYMFAQFGSNGLTVYAIAKLSDAIELI